METNTEERDRRRTWSSSGREEEREGEERGAGEKKTGEGRSDEGVRFQMKEKAGQNWCYVQYKALSINLGLSVGDLDPTAQSTAARKTRLCPPPLSPSLLFSSHCAATAATRHGSRVPLISDVRLTPLLQPALTSTSLFPFSQQCNNYQTPKRDMLKPESCSMIWGLIQLRDLQSIRTVFIAKRAEYDPTWQLHHNFKSTG